MFTNYDIRGLYPKEVNEKVASFLAYKFYLYLKNKGLSKEILLGIDKRRSSIKLANAFANSYLSLKQTKINYLGVIPSPIFYFYCIKQKRAGVIITASHLPQNYNGFKFVLPNGLIWLYKRKLTGIKSINKEIEIKYKEVYLKDIFENYIDNLKRFYSLSKKHYIDFERKNKSANYFLFKNLPGFEKNIKINKNSNLKIFSDFDGDRLWVKYKGELLLPEKVLYAILSSGKYKKVGINISFHKKILEKFPKIKFIFIPTGHTNFKKAFLKYKLDFAMEPTFHYYFFKETKTESPILALFKILEFDEKIGLDKLMKEDFFAKRFTIKKNLNINKMIKNFQKDNYKIKKIDGFYIYKKDKRGLAGIHIRQSKTETNTFRIFVESENKNILKLIENQIKKIIKKNG